MNSSEGILCFQTFGWDVIDRMLDAGFRKAEVYLIWSEHQVILGNPQPFFCATKGEVLTNTSPVIVFNHPYSDALDLVTT